ncbi:hypothetical protein D0T53_07035 [Dysgonomonas sp. 216]|uniref:tetratricopeptide repeat protein n=1 Tax=Dysgonomonas sp. 216 TaxID=2302934 RepID=UPI0013D62F3F|nr:tetratricopeptide repeat protein [Dysgonomonas sp. 216]NDW18300.1 hypothetical protein [Dysgonomonas sp. 216]NDW18668.1 hypothetical protein [Dysgonomonas sp. 216]
MREKDISDLLKKYKQMLESGRSIYFDAEEFEELSDYYDMLDEGQTAKKIIEIGLNIHPTSEILRLKKAKFMLYERKYEQALEYLQTNFNGYSLELYLLKVESFLQLGLYDDAQRLTRDILETEETDRGDAYAELGFLYTEADYFDDAVFLFEKSIKYKPDNIEALTELAYVYEMQDDFDSAIRINNKILDVDPYSYETWINIGKLYTIKEAYENAIDAFDFALTINDSDINTLKLKAHSLFLNENIDEAIELFKACIELFPDDASLYYSLSECYMVVEQYDKMLQSLDKYQEIEGESIEILAKKAFAFMQGGDLRTSAELIEKGLESEPDSEDMNAIAGELYFQQGEYEKSEMYFLKAYRTSIENSTILDRLSIISIQKGEYEKAIEYLEELLTVDVQPVTKVRLALLYFEIGDQNRFNQYLDYFSNDDLKKLFTVFFPDDQFDTDNIARESLVKRLIDARECRQLFKNINL